MQKAHHPVYLFDSFTLDLTSGCLLREGREVKLRPKSFQMLCYLVENSGRLIGKEELIEALWPDSFVTDDSLVKCLKDVRRALGGDAQQFVKTVPRRGYIFVAKVSEKVQDNSGLLYSEQAESRSAAFEGEQREGGLRAPKTGFSRLIKRLRTSPRTLVAVTVLIALAAGLYYVWISRRSNEPNAVAAVNSIAVLPFQPLDAQARNEALEVGLADSLITNLSKIKQLTVRPMSAVLKYAGGEQDPVAIGQMLRVDAVLESRFQQSGDRVRISAQLVRVEDGRVIWSFQCYETCVDVLSMQESVSESIVRELKFSLTSEEQKLLTKRHTDNAEVHRLYLYGRSEWNKRTRDGAEKAIDLFQQALERQPDYAPAYSGLADCYITLGSAIYPSPWPPRGVMPKAKYAAERALAIDDTLAEAHASLGFVLLWYDWDFAGAKREFERAIELEPKYSTAHQWYAHYLTAIGHHEEAIREARLSCELDPTSANKSSMLGSFLYHARQYNQAIEQAGKARQLDNRLRPMYSCGAYMELGRYDEAVDYYIEANALAGERPENLQELRSAYRTGGIRGFWKKLIEQYAGAARQDAEMMRYFAIGYAFLGEKNEAFAYLEKTYEERNGFLIYLKVDPRFDNLRSDPRFRELVRRVGLPQ